jgi:hypothetical protein
MTRWWWCEFRFIFNFHFVLCLLDYRRLLLFLFHVDVTLDWLQRAVEDLVVRTEKVLLATRAGIAFLRGS